MPTVNFNSFTAAIERLFDKGVRYSTVIDVGCADGHFFLEYTRFFAGAVPLNIDVNGIYEDSLRAIKEVVGGDYRIAAITDHEGEIEITESVHPYWSSIRPVGDSYWTRVNDLVKTTSRATATTLDALVAQSGLSTPFLLKLDVQGAERRVLAGAHHVLANTHAVICEVDIDDFHDINETLAQAGFVLYDVTELSRVEDGTLGWFYPIYVSKRLDNVRPSAFWAPKDNDTIINLQIERRNKVLKRNTEVLNRLKYGQAKVGRNDPCPCGSGKKFKHCCGSYGAD
jgi:FkbM family methyltransferase